MELDPLETSDEDCCDDAVAEALVTDEVVALVPAATKPPERTAALSVAPASTLARVRMLRRCARSRSAGVNEGLRGGTDCRSGVIMTLRTGRCYRTGRPGGEPQRP